MKPFIVAELSCNHQGSYEKAEELVKACSEAGADAIKLQTWTPGTMVLDKSKVIEAGPWAGVQMSELYESAHTPWEWHKPLFQLAKDRGMVGFSSVFDWQALEFLESINCPIYKIASFEAVDLTLIGQVAKTGKPIIISTGMCDLQEVNEAYSAAVRCGATEITMLECASVYPAKAEHYNLENMVFLERAYNLNAVGISDHTNGYGLAAAAVARGAHVIEKHVGLGQGYDEAFSMTPGEFRLYCKAIHDATVACDYKTAWFGERKVQDIQKLMRRSLHASRDIRAGDILTPMNVVSSRPNDGLPCRDYPEVVNSRAAVDIPFGAPISRNSIV